MSNAKNKLEVHVCDMDEEMKTLAMQKVRDAFANCKDERKMADFLTNTFFRQYNGSWNCIVGKNYGSHVVHMSQSYIFCTYGEDISILLWKSG